MYDETGPLQPVPTVYMIFVVPAVKAVTIPAAFTEAINGLLLLQVPSASPLLL